MLIEGGIDFNDNQEYPVSGLKGDLWRLPTIGISVGLSSIAEFQIDGLKTLIPFHRALLASEQWVRGETCRDLLDDRTWLKALAFEPADRKGDDDSEAMTRWCQQLERFGARTSVDALMPGPPRDWILQERRLLNAGSPGGMTARAAGIEKSYVPSAVVTAACRAAPRA